MSDAHGAETIKGWLEDFAALVRSDVDYGVGAGAHPGRDYAYLEVHRDADDHSILLFRVEAQAGEARPTVQAYRLDGTAEEIRDGVRALTHPAEADA
ncbi:MAG TPA: hypothetical protein VK837_02705 [Longimicrobiales bacterium]|nr:hypothetical protein [Longimicrobiales bacterium]